MAANELLDIDTPCATAPGYGWMTNFTCCPGTTSTIDNPDRKDSCLLDPNAGGFGRGDAPNIAVTIALPTGGITGTNMQTVASDIINNNADFIFLKDNPSQFAVQGIGLVFDAKNLVVVITEDITAGNVYKGCHIGVPGASTTTTTTTVAATTTAAGAANTTSVATAAPSGATSVGASIVVFVNLV